MKRSPPASGGGHRPDLQVGDVADVDEAEPDPRHAGHPVEQPFDRPRSENERSSLSTGPRIAPGLTTASAGLRPLLAHQVPGRALGDRLRLGVGRSARRRRGRSSPPRSAPLGDGLPLPRDRGDRGGDDDPLDAAPQGRAQDPQGPVAGGHDQLVGVLGLGRRERRGDVEDVVAAVDRLLPALVAKQVGGGEREPVAGVDLGGRSRRAPPARGRGRGRWCGPGGRAAAARPRTSCRGIPSLP